MLGFETLTLAPIDRRLIDADLLEPGERAWLDAYHARVLEAIDAARRRRDRALAAHRLRAALTGGRRLGRAGESHACELAVSV